MTRSIFFSGATRLLVGLGLIGALAGCDNLLTVNNPEAIPEESLNDEALATVFEYTVVGDFQNVFQNLAYYGALFTDEAVTGHNFETIKEMDLRQLRDDNGTLNNDIYAPLQIARASADTLTSRLRTLLDNPGADLRVARALAYSGYAYLYLAEYFCAAPINVSAAIPSDELMQRAIPRFEEAIQIATAARAGGARAASVDSIINLARVGAARAALNLGEMGRAIAFASQVPANFEFWAAYSDNSSREYNLFFGATSGSNHNLGVGPTFRGLNDPRIPHRPTGRTGHNGLTLLWTPFQPSQYEGWSPGANAVFDRSTDIRFSSGLEARYIVAEAEGPTAATLAFVNQRRAVGNQPSVQIEGDALMAELRNQRRRDFYMSAHRLGDLRRYKKLYGIDQFPSGPHPNVEWGDYGTDECFIITNNEKTGNPNVR